MLAAVEFEFSSRKTFPKLAAADRALTIDQICEAHASLGLVRFCRVGLEGPTVLRGAAIELSPSYGRTLVVCIFYTRWGPQDGKGA